MHVIYSLILEEHPNFDLSSLPNELSEYNLLNVIHIYPIQQVLTVTCRCYWYL